MVVGEETEDGLLIDSAAAREDKPCDTAGGDGPNNTAGGDPAAAGGDGPNNTAGDILLNQGNPAASVTAGGENVQTGLLKVDVDHNAITETNNDSAMDLDTSDSGSSHKENIVPKDNLTAKYRGIANKPAVSMDVDHEIQFNSKVPSSTDLQTVGEADNMADSALPHIDHEIQFNSKVPSSTDLPTDGEAESTLPDSSAIQAGMPTSPKQKPFVRQSLMKNTMTSPSPAMKYRIMCQCGAKNCRKYLF